MKLKSGNITYQKCEKHKKQASSQALTEARPSEAAKLQNKVND